MLRCLGLSAGALSLFTTHHPPPSACLAVLSPGTSPRSFCPSTYSPSRGCYYSLWTDNHQEAKSPTQCIQKIIILPPTSTGLSTDNTFKQCWLIALPRQHHEADKMITRLGSCGSWGSGRWVSGQEAADLELELGSSAPMMKIRDAGLCLSQSRMHGRPCPDSVSPSLPDLACSCGKTENHRPQDKRAIPCLLLSATMGQLRQLLPVYITRHRDHSAQLFEISYKSASNALMH